VTGSARWITRRRSKVLARLQRVQKSAAPPEEPRLTIRYRSVRIVIGVVTVTTVIVLVDFARVAVAVVAGISRLRGPFITIAPAVVFPTPRIMRETDRWKQQCRGDQSHEVIFIVFEPPP
jgi:hypothetical protein